MIRVWGWGLLTISMVIGVVVYGQQPPAGRQGGPGAAAPATPLIVRRPPVDATAAAAGKALWTANCITCHGTNARGSESRPNLVRSEVVNYDRAVADKPGQGVVLGPFLKKGHPTQSKRPSASFTEQEILQLAQFLSERVNDTMRGAPTYVVLNENVLTGDPKAGEAFFNGAGGCTKCHNASNLNLAGIGSRITNAQALQARVLYPTPAGLAPPARGGGAPAAPAPPPSADPHPLAPVTTITMPGANPIKAWVTYEDSFFITFRDASGAVQTLRKTPAMKISVNNPMQWHLDFAERLEDKQMHDLTAYLWSLK